MQSADNEQVAKPKTPEDEMHEIDMQLAYFSHVHTCAVSRKARAEELMGRKASKKWDAPKKQQMVRRLTRADQELKQSSEALANLQQRMVQLKAAGHQHHHHH
jgi:hypothetical protein